MVPLAALWLPILLSAVAVFIVSAILHMVLPYHKSDYRQLPGEDNLLAALRTAGLKRGLYRFPFCTPKDRNSPASAEKYKQGPVGMITILPSGPPAMPKYLVMWFVYCLIVSSFAACLACHVAAPGSSHRAFHVTGLAAFLAYGVSQLSNGIWKGEPWGVVIKELIDGLIYGLVTGAVFAYLWPH